MVTDEQRRLIMDVLQEDGDRKCPNCPHTNWTRSGGSGCCVHGCGCEQNARTNMQIVENLLPEIAAALKSE